MKVRSYKQLIEELNKTDAIILTVSMWTHSSKRMVLKVSFEQLRSYLDGDMQFKYGDIKISFKDLKGKQYSFRMYDLRIAKVDYVEVLK